MTMTYLLHLECDIAEAQIVREETPKDLPDGEYPMVEDRVQNSQQLLDTTSR